MLYSTSNILTNAFGVTTASGTVSRAVAMGDILSLVYSSPLIWVGGASAAVVLMLWTGHKLYFKSGGNR